MATWNTHGDTLPLHTVLIISDRPENISVWEPLFQQRNCIVLSESKASNASSKCTSNRSITDARGYETSQTKTGRPAASTACRQPWTHHPAGIRRNHGTGHRCQPGRRRRVSYNACQPGRIDRQSHGMVGARSTKRTHHYQCECHNIKIVGLSLSSFEITTPVNMTGVVTFYGRISPACKSSRVCCTRLCLPGERRSGSMSLSPKGD